MTSEVTPEPFTIGVILFDRAEELDWVGPFEVFTMAREAAGLARGKRITTHWAYLPTLRERAGEGTTVLERVRYVRDGRLLTAAGVSAGIDMALWLVGELFGVAHARLTQKLMEYDPAPPYAAEV